MLGGGSELSASPIMEHSRKIHKSKRANEKKCQKNKYMTLETPILNETPVSIYHTVCIPYLNTPISYP